MLLRSGKIVRFKGPWAFGEARAFAAELQGRCRHEGTTVLITRETRLVMAYGPHAHVPVPMFDAADAFGRNGRSDAKPPGRTLGAVSQ